jgi:hypothetical protein
MKERSLFLLIVALVFFLFAPTDNIQAQRLYDEGRDKKAQEAAKLAEEIASKSSFENQLKNLDTLSKRDQDLYFSGAKRQMELQIRAFRTWGRVNAFVGTVKSTLNAEDLISDGDVDTINQDLKKRCPEGAADPQRTTDLGKAICAAQTELKKLKKAVKDSEEQGKALEEELKTRLEKIGEIEALVDKAETFLKSGSKNNQTIKGLSEVFINLSKSYVNYTNKLEQIKNQPKDELRLLLQRIAVETLQLEADHWKTVGTIKLRRVEEQESLSSMVREFENRLTKIAEFYPCLDAGSLGKSMDQRLIDLKEEKIEATFAKAIAITTNCPIDGRPRNKEEVTTYLFQTLHVAAALSARGETPARLARLRLAQEEHRYSIRQSAVIARGYELALSSGTTRLARYYAGGLKPEKIAQLIYAAATLAIPAVIAGK